MKIKDWIIKEGQKAFMDQEYKAFIRVPLYKRLETYFFLIAIGLFIWAIWFL